MHPSAERFVGEAHDRYGFDPVVEEFPEGTKTAADAADAVGCQVAQIASSIVLVADGEVVVSVTSGANRADLEKVAAAVGADTARMADADEVKDVTGWSIGGVPPICHATSLPVVFDETLTGFETVWAAAGTPTAVFAVSPAELIEMSGAEIVDVAE
ncbi:Cys-tRNA(Pro) deacylase, prolyl-tRNA editing enzyme YbaK/EbsC [Halogranum amylolyticum]|uniref:Cys-tRNA(Pro) deacylase, prolyl-tRNA editing enzyme YbaK/EbsC n=1 Tax=Halogranum amylolyticum TaxID=660520 RepID=A0A1H8QCS5_9EURY|nr:YbaK/EbsC family protein [Halogranum amylolyticum]SEO52045.1 Cys-tRNA(Pro) deacylase, prolyl-tRNA editing enzyme YbaK/EbsC [Halogranum amylolyticum]